MKHLPLLLIAVFHFCTYSSSAQSSNYDYVPCQEMPSIIQNYQADYRALQRFYTPADNESPFERSGNSSADSPEKRQRLEALYK